jgi:hypothetical protein
MQHNSQEGFAERVRANQQKLSSEFRIRFDYIVCGTGTSGCVVAHALGPIRKRKYCCWRLAAQMSRS